VSEDRWAQGRATGNKVDATLQVECLCWSAAAGVWCCVAQVERLVCGNPNLDFEALERNSKYDGGFSVVTPAVQWLWHVSGGKGGG